MSVINLSEISILPLTKDDIEEVVKIEAEAYGKHHPVNLSDMREHGI